MKAPPGSVVSLYVDLKARLRVGDVIRTPSDRRYVVVGVRVQSGGKHAGRQHLRAVVCAADDMARDGFVHEGNANPIVHAIHWYPRRRRARVAN